MWFVYQFYDGYAEPEYIYSSNTLQEVYVQEKINHEKYYKSPDRGKDIPAVPAWEQLAAAPQPEESGHKWFDYTDTLFEMPKEATRLKFVYIVTTGGIGVRYAVRHADAV